MRRRPLGGCVLLTLILVYSTVQWNLDIIFTSDENRFRLDKTTASCYGTVEELRHSIEQDRFQVERRQHCCYFFFSKKAAEKQVYDLHLFIPCHPFLSSDLLFSSLCIPFSA